MTDHRRVTARAALAAGCALALLTAACSSGSTAATAATSSAVSMSMSSSAEVTVADQWVRATKGIADPTMTTVFGQFTNHTGKDLTIVSATNSLTGRTELHQMSMNGDAMVMGPVVGGIKLPANKTTSLDPNTLHIMLMDLKSTILPGDDVKVTAKLSDGSTVSFHALGKEFAGGNESYTQRFGRAGFLEGADDRAHRDDEHARNGDLAVADHRRPWLRPPRPALPPPIRSSPRPPRRG